MFCDSVVFADSHYYFCVDNINANKQQHLLLNMPNFVSLRREICCVRSLSWGRFLRLYFSSPR